MNTSPLRNRQSAPAFLSHLHTLRVGNLSPKYDDEELLHDFEAYGVIGDFYRPKDTRNGNARAVPYRYAFVRFFSDEDAENARRALHGQERYGEEMTVEYAVQESKFSNSTGFITNYEIVEPPRELADFDPSMPASHREKKIEEWASQVDEVYTLKVVGLNTDITPERLREIFSAFGFISTIYYPVDLRTLRTRDFALVRFIEEKDAREAQRRLDGQDVGSGPLQVFFWEQQRYFSKTPFVTVQPPKGKEKAAAHKRAIRFDL